MKPPPHPDSPLDDEILTVEEVAKLLDLEPSTIYVKAEAGELPGAFRIGETGEGKRPILRFSKRVLMEWVQKRALRPSS